MGGHPNGLQITDRLTIWSAYIRSSLQFLLEFMQNNQTRTLTTTVYRTVSATFGKHSRLDLLHYELGIPTTEELRHLSILRLYATLQTAPPYSNAHTLHKNLQTTVNIAQGPTHNRSPDSQMFETLAHYNLHQQHWPEIQVEPSTRKYTHPHQIAQNTRTQWKRLTYEAVGSHRISEIHGKLAANKESTREWYDMAGHATVRKNQFQPMPIYKMLARNPHIHQDTAQFFLQIRTQGAHEYCPAYTKRKANNTPNTKHQHNPQCKYCETNHPQQHPIPRATATHIVSECRATASTKQQLTQKIDDWMSKGNYLYNKITRSTITAWNQIPAEHQTQLLLGTSLPPHIHPAKVPKVKTTSHAWMTAFMGLTATDTHTLFKNYNNITALI